MENNFRIHSICVVKNEADIIEYCLEDAARWSDYIYVYDGESTDGTWEKVLAMQSNTIIPWQRHNKVFQESLRAEVFNAFKHQAKEGDWWCRLDADEFYLESPRSFLAKVAQKIHVIWGVALEYYLTHDDHGALDFTQPVPQLLPQLKYYKVENSEPRFFRHRSGLVWEHGSWPKHMGLVNKDRILYKHYKYRTPQQIQTRLDTRRESRERGFTGWEHAIEDDWRKKLVNIQELKYDHQNDEYEIDFEKLPNHLESFSRRTLKRVMHGVGIWS